MAYLTRIRNLALTLFQIGGLSALVAGCGANGSSPGSSPPNDSGGASNTSGAAGSSSGGASASGGSTSAGGAMGGASGSAGGGGTSNGGAAGAAGAAASGGTAATAGDTAGAAGSAGAAGGSGGAAGSGGAGTSGAGAGAGAAGVAGSAGTAGSTACGAGDTNLPAEPTIPSACKTLQATQNVAANGVPSESALDTATIQAALGGCVSGQAVRLSAGSASNAFITGPLTIPSGVSLWVDSGVTLFGTRSPTVYNGASALITIKGTGSGIYGDGVIDGQGGEPMIGGSGSFWDQNGNGGSSPALIQASGATNFTLYRITLHNSPMFHVKVNAKGFVVWGITVKTPSKPMNSAGTALSYTSAHNTDGVDPGEAASNGYIVCNKITTGDDHIAIKGSSATGVTNLTIAHNHFEAGHGMSIGSEFTGGVSGVKVYDLSVDQIGTGTGGGSSNGIRIKSDSSRGGLVNNVSYSDVCMRGVANAILLTPFYSTMTGNNIPQFTNILFQNIHVLTGGNTPKITLNGYDASHLNSVTLDNVIVDNVSAANVTASYTQVTLGPGSVNFTPSGTGVTVTNAMAGSSTPNPCTGKWLSF